MKKIFTLLILFCITYTNGQEMGISKKIFTTENFRLGAALGADLSWAGEDGGTSLIQQNGSINGDQFFYASSPNTTIFLGLDAYSPTSILGFMAGVAYNTQNYTITGQNGAVRDSITTTNIEIPIYAKLRLGNALSRSQFWIAAGGGYSINTEAEVRNLNATGTITNESTTNEQFNSVLFASGILGYEFMAGGKDEEPINRDTYRFLVYVKANYDLGNRINSEGIEPATALATYTDPSIEFLRISLGIKVLLRLSKAGELLNKGLESRN